MTSDCECFEDKSVYKCCHTCAYHLDGWMNKCDDCDDYYNKWEPSRSVLAACKFMILDGGYNLKTLTGSRDGPMRNPDPEGIDGKTWHDSMAALFGKATGTDNDT